MIQKRLKPDLLIHRGRLQLCSVSKDPIGPAARRELERVGQVIASVRVWRNMTQEDLRHRAGVSYSQVRRMERGRSDPAMSFYIRIATALDVPLYWLFAEGWQRFVSDDQSQPGGGSPPGVPGG